jgi:hypothetical protein
MKREDVLLELLLERIQEIEDLVHQAHNAGVENIRLTRLGILLAGMLHMFENGSEKDISDTVAKLVIRNIESGNEAAADTAIQDIQDLISGINGIKLN